jgi:hypothetical protein
MVRERQRDGFSGLPVFILWLVVGVLLFLNVVRLVRADANEGLIAVSIIGSALTMIFIAAGFFIVQPNEARVLQFFGTYAGTSRKTGLQWLIPFYTRKRFSLRIRSFESAHLKVNDKEGNPIEIGAIVVWKVIDTAEAAFEVDNYEAYVRVQSESALRNAATSYPYDSHDEDGVISLRGSTAAVAEHLKNEMQQRLQKAGVEVIETRISHLAYAPEIAAAMLQRQQAGAIIAARQRIVEGAVGMVEMALESLSKRGVVHLDEERKAAMVSNLLVVLCGEKAAQPVVNAGTIYQ